MTKTSKHNNYSALQNSEASELNIAKLPSSENKLGSFPARLQQAIGDRSVRSFASDCGMSDTVVRQYLSGKSEPTRPAIIAIARVSGCSIEWLLTGEGEMRRGDKPEVHDAAPGWEPSNGHPASKSAPPDGPEGYSDYELGFVLLRDIINTYEDMRPGREPERKAREITIIYRHFMEHFARHLDEVEISEYINTWM